MALAVPDEDAQESGWAQAERAAERGLQQAEDSATADILEERGDFPSVKK